MRNRIDFESSGEQGSSDGMGVLLEPSASPSLFSVSSCIEVVASRPSQTRIMRMYFTEVVEPALAESIGACLLDGLEAQVRAESIGELDRTASDVSYVATLYARCAGKSGVYEVPLLRNLPQTYR